jgi:hypothetical protein
LTAKTGSGSFAGGTARNAMLGFWAERKMATKRWGCVPSHQPVEVALNIADAQAAYRRHLTRTSSRPDEHVPVYIYRYTISEANLEAIGGGLAGRVSVISETSHGVIDDDLARRTSEYSGPSRPTCQTTCGNVGWQFHGDQYVGLFCPTALNSVIELLDPENRAISVYVPRQTDFGGGFSTFVTHAEIEGLANETVNDMLDSLCAELRAHPVGREIDYVDSRLAEFDIQATPSVRSTTMSQTGLLGFAERLGHGIKARLSTSQYEENAIATIPMTSPTIATLGSMTAGQKFVYQAFYTILLKAYRAWIGIQLKSIDFLVLTVMVKHGEEAMMREQGKQISYDEEEERLRRDAKVHRLVRETGIKVDLMPRAMSSAPRTAEDIMLVYAPEKVVLAHGMMSPAPRKMVFKQR